MAKSQGNFWEQHDLSRERLSLNADLELKLTEQQRRMEDNSNLSQTPFFSDSFLQTTWTHEGDQVVPAAKRRSVFGDRPRETKPLPPLPDPGGLMSDEAADSEVEFFTSDRQRLLPRTCPTETTCRSSCGRDNRAYQENLDSAFSSWPGPESGFKDNIWTKRDQSSPGDKPEVPPRIPLRPKPLPKTAEDRPPKIPPRVPLVPPCPPRTPSPKTLPIYINGVMPATQSFAANPKYVSNTQSPRAPPAAQGSPCIVPIVKDGRQASNTHYILLPPRRPADRRDRLVSEPVRVNDKIRPKR